MILVAHTLKTLYCFPSRWTFRLDVEEADCCQQQGGGRAHRQSGDGVPCRPGRRVESGGGGAWNQNQNLTSGEHLNDVHNANYPVLTLSTPLGLFLLYAIHWCGVMFIYFIPGRTRSFLQLLLICVGIYVQYIFLRSLQTTARRHNSCTRTERRLLTAAAPYWFFIVAL